MGHLITFHSYKGGVGRTMAVANIAVLLTQWGYKTLVMDWDLESPGLDAYFNDYMTFQAEKLPGGIIDLLDYQTKSTLLSFNKPAWKDLIIEVNLPQNQYPLHFISAGKRDDKYFRRVRKLDLDEFYEKNGGFIIEWFRDQWKDVYDFILLDSKTGITEIGSICTIQLPDILVLLFTTNRQSLNGAVDIAKKAAQAQKSLPFERLSLKSIPLLSKFDLTEEFSLSQSWLEYCSNEVSYMYSNWLPVSVDKRDFLEVTKIPYIPYYSFGEKLPALENQGTTDPGGLAFAYENLAALIGYTLESPEQLIENREEFIRCASKIEKKKMKKQKRRGFQVFLSYASEDLEIAQKIYKGLIERDFNVWFDKANTAPGPWKLRIRKAIAQSRYFLICISENALKKIGDDPGFQDNELNDAYSIAREQPNTIFTIVPVRLEDCGLYDNRINGYQFYDVFPDFERGLDKLAEDLG